MDKIKLCLMIVAIVAIIMFPVIVGLYSLTITDDIYIVLTNIIMSSMISAYMIIMLNNNIKKKINKIKE